ncbi:MAG: SDR family oxidoreductase [Proteobacteria bacterium]|nr:SDR family oxidoreductase [Pseudomonadota bacterium]
MEHRRRKILITGATGTIGSAAARALALPGASMTLCFKSRGERAEALKGELSGLCDVHLAREDLSLDGACEALVDLCCARMGGVDLLVHCAATLEKTPLGTVTHDQWGRILDTNLKAAFFLAQAAGMRMQAQAGGGSIVLISDIAGQRPYGGYIPHSISKAGIDALVRGLARALAPSVTANAVAPYIVTRPRGMTDAEWQGVLDRTPMRRASTAEEVAAIVKAVAQSETMTGQVISIDGGRLLR